MEHRYLVVASWNEHLAGYASCNGSQAIVSEFLGDVVGVESVMGIYK